MTSQTKIQNTKTEITTETLEIILQDLMTPISFGGGRAFSDGILSSVPLAIVIR